jgi:hypothetical protein
MKHDAKTLSVVRLSLVAFDCKGVKLHGEVGQSAAALRCGITAIISLDGPAAKRGA